MKELLHSSEFDGFPLDLHQAMVRDLPRMELFEAALKEVVREGDTVVDVGCGTGILALLAWRAGAGRVIAIERSEIIEPARRWIAERYPEAPIEFLRLDVEREELPPMQADVLVCELLGNLGPEERMLPVLSKVCSTMLRDGGVVVPGKVQLMAAPVMAPAVAAEMNRWNDLVCGFDLSNFDALAKERVYHLQGEAIELLAEAVPYRSMEFSRGRVEQTPHVANFVCDKDGEVHGFACWFNAQLSAEQVLCTGPASPVTHWGQVFFPLPEPVPVRAGDRMTFELTTDGDEFEVEWTWAGTIERAGQEPMPYRVQAHGSP